MENLFREEINKKLKNIVFIELKEEYQLGELKLPVGFSLPIKLDYIIEGIKDKELEEEINLEKIVEAMIYLLGIDPEFKYSKKYKEMLKELNMDIKNYAMHKAFINQETNPLDSYIFLKGCEELIGKDTDIIFKEGNILESFYNKNQEEPEKSEKLINIIIKKYNEVLNLDEKYSLAYYRLAYINLALQKYIKANMYFEKFINLSDNEELKDEVRKEIEIIRDYVNFDSAKTYLSYGEYNKALNLLNDISENFNKDESFYYVVAITFYNLGDFERAEEYARLSIDKKILEENTNLLSTLYAMKNKFDEAIEVLKMGLLEIENSYPLNYNLGIIYLNKKESEKGIEYLEKANKLKPNKELEKFIKNLKEGIDTK
ncbi:MAG: tetratricopeptide repeat protein [Peptoniphilus sp.]|uniref:tetratricopeptide repeat protein n=1 Tax=Peptoniphilus sp. TaxID=1971214 RepID=UPI0025EC4792|nr:tetratricopeptide repeat protein [Peptoniphilus sp.]MCI5643412.1 tetratricopeptide repeat protein [Peptoniphilus sp.]MDD7353144.1 tetratricopeptide repeat protein [Peptoniphilaceae bacterium]MDY3902720.1 tetratricopeptide repeat protein [Peptoniphilus sp.]